jgi:23S rRNA (pseudouridine1915-N3)-methyltransferase
LKISVIAVGRAKAGPEKSLFDHYAKRLTDKIILKEIEEKRPLTTAKRKKREAERLLDAAPKGALLIALDEKGKTLTSVAFSEKIKAWETCGQGSLAFLIGGADGLDAHALEKADFILSLGSMTWPHMLVRGLLAEQLFRAQSISSGHPYHRG